MIAGFLNHQTVATCSYQVFFDFCGRCLKETWCGQCWKKWWKLPTKKDLRQRHMPWRRPKFDEVGVFFVSLKGTCFFFFGGFKLLNSFFFNWKTKGLSKPIRGGFSKKLYVCVCWFLFHWNLGGDDYQFWFEEYCSFFELGGSFEPQIR